MKFTIDRAKWLQGESDSYLLREIDEKMCCLGFYSIACGIDKDKITGVHCPESLVDDGLVAKEEYPKWVLNKSSCKPYLNSDDINSLMTINDDNSDYTLKEKEAAIKELFAKHDVKVKFTGKYFPETVKKSPKKLDKVKYALKLTVLDKGEERTLWLCNSGSYPYYLQYKMYRELYKSKEQLEADYLVAAPALIELKLKIVKRTILKVEE